MKNIFTKTIFAALMLATFAAGGTYAKAQTAPYVSWNTASNDCATVAVANYTTQQNAASTCWGPSVTAAPGDTVNVRIYYHNTGNATSGNTIFKLNAPSTTARTSFSFTGAISGGQAQAVGGVTINLTAPSTLVFSKVIVAKDQNYTATSQYTDTSIFDGGLNIGAIRSPADCPTTNSFCHQGSVVVSFLVKGAAVTPACAITSFTASPSQVSAGSSSTLSWNTTGCTTTTVSGINGTYGANGTASTGALNATQSYMLTAKGADGVAHTLTTSVVVTPVVTSSCVVNSFYANPTQVSVGNTSTLAWNTTGCTSVSVTGVSGSAALSGTASVTPVSGTNTYTITATGTNTVTQSVTVTASAVVNNTCAINSFYASPTQVYYGGVSTLYWTTSGCTSVVLSGGSIYGGVQPLSGSATTGSVYSGGTYTLTAYGPTGSPVTQSVYISTTNNNNNQGCYVSNFYAYPTTVVSGGSTTLSWTNTNGGAVMVTGGNFNSSYQYGSSLYSGALYSTTTFTVTPVNCANGGYAQSQSVTVYVNGNNNQTTLAPITTLATNVSAYSARLNGLIVGTTYGSSNVYFEYGTNESLGLQTTQQTVNTGTSTNYFDTITTSPNTTYYYRAALSYNGTIYRGSIISFTTPSLAPVYSGGDSYTYVAPTRTVVTAVPYGVGAGSSFLSLSMVNQFQSVAMGDMIIYTINYKNITAKPLTNAVLNVILPEGVVFRQSTQGVLTTNNTVVANLGTINSLQEGTVVIQAYVDTVMPGSTLVATSTVAFTAPSGAQDSAIAYAVNTVMQQRSNIANRTFFGFGFFPGTLLGWIILIAIIILLVILIRRLVSRPAVVVNNHHDSHGHDDHGHGSHH